MSEQEQAAQAEPASVGLNLDNVETMPVFLTTTFKRSDHLVEVKVYQDEGTSDVINTISILPKTPDTPARTYRFTVNEDGAFNIEF